ncbi:hypothetical protein SpCBS45565_g01325 [Spizellomyces sp. 'palustris']|nr:hypothetical protein SpCBS45565_g01325 [Spizellomyces sp. 'palustris']
MTPPRVEDYVARPLEIIHELIDQSKMTVENVRDQFSNAFQTDADLSLIPSLNRSSLSTLPDRSLEYFTEITLRNTTTGEEVKVSTLYCDTLQDRPGFTVVDADMMNFSSNNVAEKQPVFCVSVPGETDWAREGLRRIGEDKDDVSSDIASLSLNDASTPFDEKLRVKFPIPQEKNAVGAMVKTYGEDPQFHLNDVLDVVGVLEKADNASEGNQGDDIAVDVATGMEFALPPDGAEQACFSSIPRIHAVFFRNLGRSHMNPSVRNLSRAKELASDMNIILLRTRLLEHFCSQLFGDRLAAEYLLLHLLSKIHHRATDGTPIGYFPINICGCPSTSTHPDFTSSIAQLVSSLVPRFHRITLTLKHLNEDTHLVPAQGRDGEKDDIGVSAGELQLADGTYILVDEMTLEDGVLKERGVLNVAHLGEVIRTAKLPYIIRYGEMKRNVDYNFLVLSQGRCMFAIDCIVPLVPTTEESVATPIPDDLKNDARIILGLFPEEDYQVPGDMVELIGRQYAEQRAADFEAGRPVTTNLDLSRRLEVARLVTKSFGRGSLDVECWDHAGMLESERMARVKKLPERGSVRQPQSGLSVGR